LFIKFNIETGLVEDTVDTYNLAGGNTINSVSTMIDDGTHIWMLINFTNAAVDGFQDNRWLKVEKFTMTSTVVLDDGNANLASFVSSYGNRVGIGSTERPAIIGNKLWFETEGFSDSIIASYDVDTLTAIDSYGPFTNGLGNPIIFDAYVISSATNTGYLNDRAQGLATVDLTNGTSSITRLPGSYPEISDGLSNEAINVVDLPVYEITGRVTLDGSPAALTVVLLDQDTNTYIKETISSAVDGSYTLTCLSPEPKTVVCKSPDNTTNYDVAAHRIPTIQA